MERRVFVSVTSTRGLDDRRRAIKAAILDRITRAGYAPQEFWESGIAENMAWNFENVQAVMQRCVGAVVIGFPRWTITQDSVEIGLVGDFNHYEGAVAITLGLPVMVIAEQNVEGRVIVWSGAGKAITDLPSDAGPDWVTSEEFEKRFGAWQRELTERRDVFLGYCSKSRGLAYEIQVRLERLGATVLNWAMDFTAGASILNELEEASALCTSGVFLFTEDDPLEGAAGVAAPRDNVVFEAGHFMATKGPTRCLIIREGAAKMPADVGGAIYVSLAKGGDAGAIEGRLRDFLESNL